MPELSPRDRATLSHMTGDMVTLLLLDDAWTDAMYNAWIEQTREDGEPVSVDGIADEMAQLLQRMGEAAEFIGSLPRRMGDDLQARFDALMWGEGLSTADRDDLRWLVTRAGGVTGLVQSTTATLSTYPAEIAALQEQVQQVQSGETAEGDLSAKFRCGLGSGLLISGIAAIPAAGMAGAGAAVAVGGAVAAGVLVGATGGVGAIVVITAAILVMRRQKC
jgi:hypothetical protein